MKALHEKKNPVAPGRPYGKMWRTTGKKAWMGDGEHGSGLNYRGRGWRFGERQMEGPEVEEVEYEKVQRGGE